MGEFDRILKENIAALFTPLLEKLLNISILKSEEMKDKLQQTIEREPDFLRLVTNVNEYQFILQLEFQTKDDPKMAFRMAEYKAILQRKYEIPVRQLVIYLGTKPSKMETKLPDIFAIAEYELKDLRAISLDQTLESSIPEEIIMSILVDFPRPEATSVITQVIKNLKRVLGNNPVIERYIKQLLVLARLRNLHQETKQIVEDMPITYDITKDELYLEGIEEGIEKNKITMIKNMLTETNLSIEQVAKVADASIEYVMKVSSATG